MPSQRYGLRHTKNICSRLVWRHNLFAYYTHLTKIEAAIQSAGELSMLQYPVGFLLSGFGFHVTRGLGSSQRNPSC